MSSEIASVETGCILIDEGETHGADGLVIHAWGSIADSSTVESSRDSFERLKVLKSDQLSEEILQELPCASDPEPYNLRPDVHYGGNEVLEGDSTSQSDSQRTKSKPDISFVVKPFLVKAIGSACGLASQVPWLIGQLWFRFVFLLWGLSLAGMGLCGVYFCSSETFKHVLSKGWDLTLLLIMLLGYIISLICLRLSWIVLKGVVVGNYELRLWGKR